MLHLPTVIYSPWLSSSFVLCIHLYILFFVEKGASTFSVFTFRFTHGLTCFPPPPRYYADVSEDGACGGMRRPERFTSTEGPGSRRASSPWEFLIRSLQPDPKEAYFVFLGRGEAHLIIPPNYPSIRTATSTLHMAHRGPLFASCSFVESIKWLNTGSTNYLDGRF